jgi:GxxExxY protein
MQYADLSEKVIGCAYTVYNSLGGGFVESVYEKAMLIELCDIGLDAEAQVQLDVVYRGRIVGHFVADLIVEKKIILELKAVESLIKAHEVQLVNYLTATGIELGLLLNFGPEGVVIRRKVRDLAKLPSCPST